jgi:hypothetical protein
MRIEPGIIGSVQSVKPSNTNEHSYVCGCLLAIVAGGLKDEFGEKGECCTLTASSPAGSPK